MMFDQPNNINLSTFRNEYWQKKPVVIKQALPNFKDPISPEELAGLACEEAIDSRIITTKNETWEVKNGPFAESDFTSLPDHNWTLLVQSVDPWFQQVKQLLGQVSFLPSWRIDDVMVSYAEKNSGAGPHFDYYDVFIVQGKGSRTWKIGQQCDSSTELSSDSGLKLLKHFEQQEEWQLHSGDVLYIPPGRAHYGVSIDSSLSYSIGFRAPSLSEMIISYSDEVCAELTEDQRYQDAKIDEQIIPGQIADSALELVQQKLVSALNNPTAINNWFGKHLTETKLPGMIEAPVEIMTPVELKKILLSGQTLQKHPISRIAWLNQNNCLNVFADGDCFIFSDPSSNLLKLNTELNTAICELNIHSEQIQDDNCLQLLCDLFNQGTIEV